MFTGEIIVRIRQDAVAAGTVAAVADVVESMLLSGEDIGAMRGNMLIDLQGFDEDPAVLLDTPQVVRWFLTLDEAYPYLLFFLSDEELPRYCAMFVPSTPEAGAIRFDRDELGDFLLRKASAIVQFCADYAISPNPSLLHLQEVFGVPLSPEQFQADTVRPRRDTGDFLLPEATLPEAVGARPHAPEFAGGWEFAPQVFKSPDIAAHFHQGAVILPLRDIAEEPVLFVLVEDPRAAYRARVSLDFELNPTQHFPLVVLKCLIHDRAEAPLMLASPFNVDDDEHLTWLERLSTVGSIMTNVLFYGTDNLLYWGFTVPVTVPSALVVRVRDILDEARNQKMMIPEEFRDFNQGVAAYCTALEHSPEPPSSVPPGPPPLPRRPPGATPPPGSVAGLVTGLEDGGDPEASIGRTITVEVASDQDMPTQSVRKPARRDNAALPDHLRRIEQALSTPHAHTEQPATEPVAAQPAPMVTVIKRQAASPEGLAVGFSADRVDDQVERMSRKLVVLESRLEQKVRENLKLKQDLEELNRRLRNLEAEDLLADKGSWWRRRKKPALNQED